MHPSAGAFFLQTFDLRGVLRRAGEDRQNWRPAPASALASTMTRLELAGGNTADRSSRSTALLVPLRDKARTDVEQTWLRYFKARAQGIAGEWDAAAAAFEALISSDVRFPSQGYGWRQHLTVGQAARLELGRIADLRGERETAIAHYETLLASLDLSQYSTDYHSDYLHRVIGGNWSKAQCYTPTGSPVTNAHTLSAAARSCV